jgi:hypothetical protein
MVKKFITENGKKGNGHHKPLIEVRNVSLFLLFLSFVSKFPGVNPGPIVILIYF